MGSSTLPRNSARTTGAEWHASSRAREAFSAAIAQRFEGYAYLAKKGPSAEGTFEPSGPPAFVGRIRETDDRHLHCYPLLNSTLPAKRQAEMNRLGARHVSKKGGSE